MLRHFDKHNEILKKPVQEINNVILRNMYYKIILIILGWMVRFNL